MKLVALIDSVALERELLTRLELAHGAAGVAGRTLVLLPTRRLASHIERRLLERRASWLGIETLTFGGLVRRRLASDESTAPAAASPLLLEALLTRCLRSERNNVWSRHARRRPGTVGRLGDSMRDLREAAIEPDELERAVDGSEAERDLSAIYRSYCRALDELARRGFSDEAGLARAAEPGIAAQAARYRQIFVYGAYEFLGVYQRLLQALDAHSELTLFTPLEPGTRASAYAEHHARVFLSASPEKAEAPCAEHDASRAQRLAMLHDEQADRLIDASPRLACRHTQGAAAEIGSAVRRALADVRDGVDPGEISIVARSLEPYAAAIEQCLEEAGLSWSSSLASPLRRQPVVRDFLQLLGTVSDDFPRDATVRLLHARRVDWSALIDGEAEACASAATVDRWTLEAGLLGGLNEWQTLLPEFVGKRSHRRAEGDRQLASALAGRLERLSQRLPETASSWSEHAGRFGSLLDIMFRDGDDPAHARLEQLIETMALQQTALEDDAQPSLADAVGWLERAVAGTTIQLHRDGHGIRVLDLMQARGLTFRRIHWVGMNSGLFPRRLRRDPVLNESLRERLVRSSGRPLGATPPEADEEHLLLALVVGSATEQVDFSWQRADESGRANVPSLALREVARIATGRPDMQAWIATAEHIPSHPAQALQCGLDSTGLLHPAEERLLAALRSRAVEASTRLTDRFPELAPGMRLLQATQSFEPVQGIYDGRLAEGAQSLTISVSRAEDLGNCPLRYFFAHVLGVRALQQRASSTELAANELGTQIHDLLERIYRQLDVEKLFEEGTGDTLARRGLELLDDSGHELFGELQRRLAARLPLLWRSQERSWLEALRRFIAEDLRRIGETGQRPVQFEQLISRELDFGESVHVTLRGKFDRVFVGDDGVPIVGDYKTSKSLSRRVDRGGMLKGTTLQVPLYWQMMEGPASVELMAINPQIAPDDEGRRAIFDGFDDDQQSAFRETMRVILQLPLRGAFPFRSGKHCEWCEFQLSCRRLHPPSQERELHTTDSEAFRALADRSASKPHGR